jgi:hypothetical protein
VLGLDDHADSFGMKVSVEPVRNLFGQPFLHLRATREVFDDPRQLGQPENALPGQVANVGDADERQ